MFEVCLSGNVVYFANKALLIGKAFRYAPFEYLIGTFSGVKNVEKC